MRSQHNVTKGGKRYLARVDPVPAEGVFVGTHFAGRNACAMSLRLSMVFRGIRGLLVSVGLA